MLPPHHWAEIRRCTHFYRRSHLYLWSLQTPRQHHGHGSLSMFLARITSTQRALWLPILPHHSAPKSPDPSFSQRTTNRSQAFFWSSRSDQVPWFAPSATTTHHTDHGRLQLAPHGCCTDCTELHDAPFLIACPPTENHHSRSCNSRWNIAVAVEW